LIIYYLYVIYILRCFVCKIQLSEKLKIKLSQHNIVIMLLAQRALNADTSFSLAEFFGTDDTAIQLINPDVSNDN